MAVQLDRRRDSTRVPGQPLDTHAVKAIRSSSKRYASEVAPNIQQLPEIGRDIRAIATRAQCPANVGEGRHVMDRIPDRHLIVGERGKVHQNCDAFKFPNRTEHTMRARSV